MPIKAAKQRVLLASLLVDANRVVPVEVLVTRLWDMAPPRGARNTVQNYVMRLRGAVSDTAEPVVIETRPEGYLIEVADDAVDLHRFRALVRSAETVAADHPEQASKLAGEALELWRGPPLLDVPSEVLHRDLVPALMERRLAAVELGIAVDLRLRRPRDLIGELRELTAAHPLRERLWGQLILALYQAGRQAEALECYHGVAGLLAEELGVDPGPQLRELHQAVLTNDPDLSPPAAAQQLGGREIAELPAIGPLAAGLPAGVGGAAAGSATAGSAAGRNDLPGDLPDLTGREDDLRTLLAALPADQEAPAVVVVAIDGMAGVGKTTFAVHAAHQLCERYPDAQLFLDLHGHTAEQEPTSPVAALEVLLHALGVSDDQIPDSLEERTGLWRAELAGRRALVVLDDAATAAQVRPLVPGGAGCLVLITSRRRLTDLDTAHTHTLDVLSPVAARALFSRIVGADRASAQPAAAEAGDVDAAAVPEVVRLCGYLPLAIRVAASRLRDRPAWRVVHLVSRLRDEQRRLAELAAGDRSVAAEFALSYQHLTGAQQRLFRLLGLVPGDSFDAPLAAVLVCSQVPAAEQLLEELVDVHLLQQPSPGRYRFQGLLRDHAFRRALQAESEAERQAARRRLFDFYLHTASAATRHCFPAAVQPPLRQPAVAVRPLAFADKHQAAAWLEAEAGNLRAAIGSAAGDGPELYARLLHDVLNANDAARPQPYD